MLFILKGFEWRISLSKQETTTTTANLIALFRGIVNNNNSRAGALV